MTNASRPRRRPKGAEGPPTKAMLRALRDASRHPGGVLALNRVQATNEKALIGSLVKRGHIRAAGSVYVITDAGREAAKGAT